MRDRRGNWIWDSDYRQRRDIEDALGREERLEHDMVAASRYMRGLREQVQELQLTVGVLLQMLGESNQIDPKIVRYRVEAALEELRAPPQVTPPVPEMMPATITCVRCHRGVPPSKTIMTADGPCCDPTCRT